MNAAQRMAVAMGVSPDMMFWGKFPASKSFTKKGPGRRHDYQGK
jgi:hypothetical protein